MNRLYAALSALIVCICSDVRAQDADPAVIFANTTAMKQPAATFYQVEGYTVFDAQEAMPFVGKGFRMLNKKYKLSGNAAVTVDSFGHTPVAKVVDTQRDNGVMVSKMHYYIKEGKMIRVVGFATAMPRDTAVETFFLNRVLARTVPDSVFVKSATDSVRFAGRKVPLLPSCGWPEMNSVQCSQQGQMNWTLYRTYEQAAQMTKNQYTINQGKGLYTVQKEEEVNIELEGQKTVAKKVTYKVKLPNFIMGSNTLYVFYAAVPIRGRYVSCVLSYFDNQGNDKELPYLLRQVMKVE